MDVRIRSFAVGVVDDVVFGDGFAFGAFVCGVVGGYLEFRDGVFDVHEHAGHVVVFHRVDMVVFLNLGILGVLVAAFDAYDTTAWAGKNFP